MTISRNLSILAEGVSSSGVLAVTNGGTGVTTSTGTGNVVLSASPTLTGTLTVPTVTSPAATALTIQSAGTTAMTIDTSQNVGIGTTSPGYKLTVNGQTSFAANQYVRIGAAFFAAGDGSTINYLFCGSSALAVRNSADSAEFMRIDSSGSLQIGTTALGGTVKLGAYSSTSTSGSYAQILRNSSATDLFVVRSDGLFITGNAASSPYNLTTASAANVNVDANGGLYRSTSSLRYKTNVQDYGKGLADLLKLRPVTFSSKPRDGDDTPDTKTYAGFIAEEVDAAGLSEFVQYNADNQPDALAYANMVALLTAAIQELSAKNDALEIRLAKLEGK